ncbi:hypothetical protein ABT340_06550 [Streptosporangium sp. NPDC000239]|uniref:hypothetical protein n=1 Tax=Streptosporangium sp. NPDC000239 TaxID=3154248 RepID=UPI00332DB262
MGKLDGMDPKLVRDLLSEVRQAAERMRTTEGRVARMMSAAGLSAQSTHRPVQVAESCDIMVRDVSSRVELLEKRVKQEGGSPAGQPVSSGEKAEDHKEKTSGVADARGEASKETDAKGADAKDHAKPAAPKAEDLKPAVRPDDDQKHKPDAGPKDGHSGSDTKPDPKPDAGSKGDERSPREGHSSSSGGRTDSDAKPDAGSKGDERSPRDGHPGPDTKPEAKPDAKPDAKHDTGSKGDERSPRDGHPGPDTKPDAKPDAGSKGDERSDTKPDNASKDDERSPRGGHSGPDAKPDAGSKGDERSPRDGDSPYGSYEDAGSKGDERPSGEEDSFYGSSEGDSSSDAKPDAGSKGDERSPRGGDSPYGSYEDAGSESDERSSGESGSSYDSSSDAKPDAGSKGDERSPRDGDSPYGSYEDAGDDSSSDAKPDAGSKGDERSPRSDGKVDILDTPQKDHPDDVDQAGGSKAKVVEMDGAKVLQIPLDSPTAEQVNTLLDHIEDVPLLDAADGDPDPGGTAPQASGLQTGDAGSLPQGDDGNPGLHSGPSGADSHQAGKADPYEALPSAKPALPIPDTVEQALDPAPQNTGTQAVGAFYDGGTTEQAGTHTTTANTHAAGSHGTSTHVTGTHAVNTHAAGTHPASDGAHKTIINTGSVHPVAHSADPKDGVLAQWAKEADEAGGKGGAGGFYGDDWEEEGTWKSTSDGQGDSRGAVLREDPSRPSTPSGPGAVK